ncbi:uncharacterized protein TA07625 [Theileria annulata]|uniref:Uncharacterized protein n=1 Tax=Theileria annulata TaxID=5874 RepID=Q4UA25_THEAN|nr:uncharacterized protein TA07625 [Theileria annulata]CAI76328.1 hypothetical protein TA07625 [Theileria annulata]|eukprot:XP_952952.1 hypothetical protein TA07625 [Theileria annulata]
MCKSHFTKKHVIENFCIVDVNKCENEQLHGSIKCFVMCQPILMGVVLESRKQYRINLYLFYLYLYFL